MMGAGDDDALDEILVSIVSVVMLARGIGS